MATVSDINQQIGNIEQALETTREQIAWRLRSLANVSDKYQANAAYRAKLLSEVSQLTSVAASQQQALDTAIIDRNKAQQTAQQQVSPATDRQADKTVQYADAAQSPPYDDNGYLNPGWQINPDSGQPYYTGNIVDSRDAAAINPDDDPFEAARRESAQNQNLEQPTESAANVDPLSAEELNQLEQAQAINQAQLAQEATDVEQDADPYEAARVAADERATAEQAIDVDPLSDEEINLLEQAQEINRAQLAQEATDVEPDGTGYPEVPPLSAEQQAGTAVDDGSTSGIEQQIGVLNARAQAARSAALDTPSSADWRVRLSLAAGSDYLYNLDDQSGGAGILAPLRVTNGVVFPYTPSIETNYMAKYQQTDLVHSNYRGYFYQNSYIDTVTIKGMFTAQDTKEAQYLLAVIHFFRSVTKMFYGAKDSYAGTPPPLVYLNGYGKFQFNNHPCLVASFNYSLPSDVDYIRADGFNNYNINLENRRNRSSGAPAGGTLGSFLANKLGINKLFAGGVQTPQTQSTVNQSVNLNKNISSTYVPTKMEMSIQLYPIQTRQQVSQVFNLKDFSNGQLLKKGFW